MKGAIESSNSLGGFLSPGTSEFVENGAFSQKGWNSERVPHPSATSRIIGRRQIRGPTTPYYVGRTLPSKWEDAERWICSPFANLHTPVVWENASTNSRFVENRRHRSKSGPIVPPPEIGCYYCSPEVSIMAEAPVTTRVLMADGGGLGNSQRWMDLVSEASSYDTSKDADDIKDDTTLVSVVVSRRNVATQMSSEATSPNHSPKQETSSPFYPSVIVPQQEIPFSPQVREVKVDEGASMVRGSRRSGSKSTKRGQSEFEDSHKNATAAYASSWNVSESAMSIPKMERKEAKITAWENLQVAKAEASIRKLEMKLERKRSESTDKIMNKLQRAQLKAMEMRSSVPSRQDGQIGKHTSKIKSFRNRRNFTSSLASCFRRRIDSRSSLVM